MAFRFLDLPAELRNCVYHFAATDNPVHISKIEGGPRTYAGLTRVCRQIRIEYCSMQRSEAQISVKCKHIGDFVGTFLATPEQQAGPPKELYILLPTERKVDREVPICKNIMLLVLAKIASPSFHCQFETVKALASSSDQRVPDRDSWDGWDNQMRDTASSLNQLIENDNPAWKDMITSGKITNIELWCQEELYVSFAIGHNPWGIADNQNDKDERKLDRFFDNMWRNWGFSTGFRDSFALLWHCIGGDEDSMWR